MIFHPFSIQAGFDRSGSYQSLVWQRLSSRRQNVLVMSVIVGRSWSRHRKYRLEGTGSNVKYFFFNVHLCDPYTLSRTSLIECISKPVAMTAFVEWACQTLLDCTHSNCVRAEKMCTSYPLFGHLGGIFFGWRHRWLHCRKHIDIFLASWFT